MADTRMSYTPEETLALISEKAKQNDRFIVRIFRRRGVTGLPENIATLADATVENLSNPETWLPVLCGGGEYQLRVVAMDEPNIPLGGILVFKYAGEPHAPRPEIVGRAPWVGPGSIMFPVASAVTNAALQNALAGGAPVPMSSFQGGGQQQQGGNGAGVSFAGGYGPPGGQAANFAPQQGYPQIPPQFAADIEAARENLRRREAEIAEARLRVERDQAQRDAELKQREREAALRAEMEHQRRELEAKLASAANAQSSTKDIVTALAPLVAGFLAKNAEVAAENRRAQEAATLRFMEMMQAQAQQTQALLLKMNEKPAVDPAVQMLLEHTRTSGSANAEMMTRMVDAMGTVSKTSVGMIQAIADLHLGGEPENPVLTAVKEGVKALASLSSGAEKGARRQVQQAQQAALPPGRQAPPPQQRQTNGAPAQARQQPNGANAGAQVLHEVPGAPAPNIPPATESAVAQSQSFDGLIQQDENGEAVVVLEEGKVIATLKELIMQRHDVTDVAQFVMAALETNEFQGELKKHNGDFRGIVADHLGAWALGNMDYLNALTAAIQEALGQGDEGGDEGEEGDEA